MTGTSLGHLRTRGPRTRRVSVDPGTDTPMTGTRFPTSMTATTSAELARCRDAHDDVVAAETR
jgi:hypothetical protein